MLALIDDRAPAQEARRDILKKNRSGISLLED